MKDFPVIKTSSFTYVRLKALNWIEYGLASPDNVQARVGARLAKMWRDPDVGGYLIVNCVGVTGVFDHALEDLRETRKIAAATLIIFGGTPSLIEEIRHAIFPNPQFHSLRSGGLAYVVQQHSSEVTTSAIESLIREAIEAEERYVEGQVADSFKKNEDGQLKRLSSTPLLASGEFNARKLICERKSFVLIVLRMVDELHQLLEEDPLSNACLLCVSLRASPLAAAIAMLHDPPLEIEIVDHMGPNYTMLEDPAFRGGATGLDYIFVGDFLIGGTELKLAANYAFNRGSLLRHSLSIGRWLDPGDYLQSPANVISLVHLQGLRADATYQFGTV